MGFDCRFSGGIPEPVVFWNPAMRKVMWCTITVFRLNLSQKCQNLNCYLRAEIARIDGELLAAHAAVQIKSRHTLSGLQQLSLLWILDLTVLALGTALCIDGERYVDTQIQPDVVSVSSLRLVHHRMDSWRVGGWADRAWGCLLSSASNPAQSCKALRTGAGSVQFYWGNKFRRDKTGIHLTHTLPHSVQGKYSVKLQATGGLDTTESSGYRTSKSILTVTQKNSKKGLIWHVRQKHVKIVALPAPCLLSSAATSSPRLPDVAVLLPVKSSHDEAHDCHNIFHKYKWITHGNQCT